MTFDFNVKKLTPEEETYRAYIEKHRDLVLAAIQQVSDVHKMVVLKEAVVAVVRKDIPQGMKQKAVRLFFQQVVDTLSEKAGQSIEGLDTTIVRKPPGGSP